MKVLTILALLVATFGVFLTSSRSEETPQQADEVKKPNVQTFDADSKRHETIDGVLDRNEDTSNDDNGEDDDDDANDDDDDGDDDEEKPDKIDNKEENDDSFASSSLATSDDALKSLDDKSEMEDEDRLFKRSPRGRRRRKRRRRTRRRRRRRRFFRRRGKGLKKVGKFVGKLGKDVLLKDPRIRLLKKVVQKVCRIVQFLGDEESDTVQMDPEEFEEPLTERDLKELEMDEAMKVDDTPRE